MLIVHLVVAGIFLVLGTVFVEAYVCAGGVLGRGGAQRNFQKHDFSVGRHSAVCGCDCRRSRLD